MKILHLISGGDVGGAKTHVHLLLQGLSKTDEILLICFKDGAFAHQAAELGIRTEVLDAGVAQTVSRLCRRIGQEGFEIIHCHGSRANMIGMLLKKRAALPVVTTVHSDYRLDYMGRPLAALTYGVINKLALRRLDNWIGVSDATARMLISRGFDPQRVFRLYNSVSFDGISPKLSRTEFFESVGLPVTEDSVVFGIAARISPVKDMETLIRAFAQVIKQYPAARLLIAGDGEQRAELEQLAAELCPQETYRFCGWLDDTDSFYNALDVNMLTSVSEGFPYAIPEGARMHCATISSDVGGVSEIIDHEIHGLLFAPKDFSALTACMLRLAGSAELRSTYAERLYERAEREFSMDAMLRTQKEIYTSVQRQYARKKSRRRDGVVLCGAYGKGNSGDEAILSVIVAGLRERDPELPITVLSRKPSETRCRARVNALHTFDLPRIYRAMRKSTLYLSGGGSLIQDATSTRSLLYYLHSIRDAKRRGCRVMMFGCGIGPVRRPNNRKRAAKYIGKYVDAITLRDAQSLEELHRLGADRIPARVTADLALLLEPAEEAKAGRFLAQNNIPSDAPLLLLAPRPWQGAEDLVCVFADAAEYAHRQYGLHPLLFAMEPGRDRAVCLSVAGELKRRGLCADVLDAPDDAALCIGTVCRARAVLSMRLHTLIYAASQGVPCAGVVYDPKVSGFLQSLERRQMCSLEEANGERLCRLVDGMMHTEGISAAALRHLAEENFTQAASLLAGK